MTNLSVCQKQVLIKVVTKLDSTLVRTLLLLVDSNKKCFNCDSTNGSIVTSIG